MSDSNDVSVDRILPNADLLQHNGKRSFNSVLRYGKYVFLALLIAALGMIVGVGVGQKDARRAMSPHYVESAAPDARKVAEAIGVKDLVFTESTNSNDEFPLTVDVGECGVVVSSPETYGFLSTGFNTPADANGFYQDSIVVTLYAMKKDNDAERFVNDLGTSLKECESEVPKVLEGQSVDATHRLNSVKTSNPIAIETVVDRRGGASATAYVVGYANGVVYVIRLNSFNQNNVVDRALNVAGVITSNLYRKHR